MAECIFVNLLKESCKLNAFEISSAAAHRDEIGNIPHRKAVEILFRHGVPLIPHRARLMTREDAAHYDLLIGMDEWNIGDMKAIAGEEYACKVKRLLDFSARPRDVADPWYTGDFETAYRDIDEGCRALLGAILAGKV